MAIKWVPDLGAPLAVIAVDLTIESTAPDYSKWATGLMAVGGYLASGMGWGGDFAKNLGIAALPAFGKNLYDYARGGASSRSSGKMAFRRVAGQHSRYPAPASSAPFGQVKLT